jgi:adenosylcobinamide-GDP ribazoletransferase
MIMSRQTSSQISQMFAPDAVMRALGFLSRLPVPARFFNEPDKAPADDAAAYPLAGVVIALPGALALLVTGALTDPLLAAALAVLTTIALTGALHEDGLADAADGFGGGASAERRLAIMKDSAIGAYGVIAVTGSMLLRIVALAAIAEAASPLTAALAFIAAHGVARAAMVWHWIRLAGARPGGTADAAGQPTPGAMNAALLGGGAVFLLAIVLPAGLSAAAVAGLLVLGATAAFARLCRRMIGGHTGDTIGACEQIAEATLLIGLAMAI